MNLTELCEKIELQPEMAERVMDFAPYSIENPAIQETLPLLFHPDTWKEGLDRLRALLLEDTDGSRMLTCLLLCSLRTYDIYQETGIEASVFFDTFRCFSRFIAENHIRFGRLVFDREWWVPRQISLKLFRLGELEYELLPSTGENTLRIHIPTGADLTPARLQESIQMADAFLQTFFPAYASANMYCNSWLLSPALKALLPDTSRIRQFQNAFIIEKTDPDAQDYLTWVYRCPTFPSPSLEALPEQTSLQKAMKQYLLRGGKIGTGYGRLKGF